MNTTLHSLLLAAAVSCACAQTLAPELAPHAAKYKADIAALEAQRVATLAQAQKPYLAALVAAEKTATAVGNVAVVAAITTERTALGSGLMAPAFPGGLPKDLQSPRKAYLEANARNRAAEAPRRQAIDAGYLRAHASLETKAVGNPELAQQLAAEKEKLLASSLPGATAATGNAGSGKPNGKSAVVNGTFDLADDNGRASGWTTSDSFKVVRDGMNNILHGTAAEFGNKEIKQDIPVPQGAKSMTISVRVRGKWKTRDTTVANWGASVAAIFINADNQQIGTWMVLNGGHETGWKSPDLSAKILNGSKVLQVRVQVRAVTGNFDFDDIVVEFR